MINTGSNNGDYDYRAIDFLYHSAVLIYSVVTVAPAYKLFSVLSSKETWGHSLYPILVVFCLMAGLMPLSFFRGIRRGELLLMSFARFAVVPHVSPSWLHGGIFATFRAVTLPFFLILPFLIAFPASCSYPVNRLMLFVVIPPLLFLLAAIIGVIFALRHFYVGKNSVLRSEDESPFSFQHVSNGESDLGTSSSNVAGKIIFLNSCASSSVSLVLPLIIFIPLFLHRSLVFHLLAWQCSQTAVIWAHKALELLTIYWFIPLSLIVVLYCVLLLQLKRFYIENQSMRFNHELKKTCGYSKFREMLAAFIFPLWFDEGLEDDRDRMVAQKILWGGFLFISLEILWLLPIPIDPWERMFYNIGTFLALSIPVACYAWPDWEMAFGYDFWKLMKKCSLAVVVSMLVAVLIMVWKETFVGAIEFIVYIIGYFLVFGAVVSSIQMLHPQVITNIDSPGGGRLTSPSLDGFVLFLMESVSVLVGASWATGVYLQHGDVIAHKAEAVWLMVNVINGLGITFFFIIVPLWVCFDRMSPKRLNGEPFLKK